jgi:L-lysine 2,3-aminomutase
MSAERLARHLLPLLEVPTVETIRIGTKSIGYWPARLTTDPDAAQTLDVLRQVVDSGRTLAMMLHFSHPRELATHDAQAALSRLHQVGARLYAQAPLIAHVNDDADVWTELWREEHRAGMVPYYMFVERDTGPRDYFEVPLRRARSIFVDAVRNVPGLARTVRGPVMSTTPGKVLVGGDVDVAGTTWTTCELVQARDKELVGRPFLAQVDDRARWLDDLVLHPGTPADLAQALRP